MLKISKAIFLMSKPRRSRGEKKNKYKIIAVLILLYKRHYRLKHPLGSIKIF